MTESRECIVTVKGTAGHQSHVYVAHSEEFAREEARYEYPDDRRIYSIDVEWLDE